MSYVINNFVVKDKTMETMLFIFGRQRSFFDMFSFPVWHLCCHQNVVSNLVWYDTVSGKSLFYQLLKIELNIFSSSSHSQLFGKQTEQNTPFAHQG